MRAWIAVSLISSSLVAVSLLPAGGVRGAMGSRMASDALTLRGELTHPGAEAVGILAPEAVAVVEARAGTTQDAPVVMRLNLPLNGRQMPVPFVLSIPRERLDPGAALYLRGGVSVRGRPAWATAPVRLEPRRDEQDLGALRLLPAAGLHLAQASGQPSVPPELALLAGEAWTVTAIGDDELPDTERPVTLRFGADGTVAGQGPCNSFRGTYRVTESRLALGQIASTLMACTPAIMARERAFLDALREISDLETPGEGLLVLRTPDGRTLEAKR